MFNIGGGELIVILLIALIVLGPQRLPDAARQLGKAMGDLRRLSTGFQNEMKQALETADDPTRIAAAAQRPRARRGRAGRRRRSRGGRSGGAARTPPPRLRPPSRPRPTDPVADSIAAVSAQPSAPPKLTPPASEARAVAKKEASSDVSEPTPPSPNP